MGIFDELIRNPGGRGKPPPGGGGPSKAPPKVEVGGGEGGRTLIGIPPEYELRRPNPNYERYAGSADRYAGEASRGRVPRPTFGREGDPTRVVTPADIPDDPTKPFGGQAAPYGQYDAYYTGDEWLPANWGGDQIFMLQQDLAKAGYLTSEFSRAVWDDTSRSAFTELLAEANAKGISWSQQLTEVLQEGGTVAGGGVRMKVDENGNLVPVGGEEIPPLQIVKSDPAALRQVFRAATIELLGEGWSQEQINDMVAAYHQIQIKARTEAYNLEISGKPGSITEPPSPESFAQSFIEEEAAPEMQEHEALGFARDFMTLAGSPAWGASVG